MIVNVKLNNLTWLLTGRSSGFVYPLLNTNVSVPYTEDARVRAARKLLKLDVKGNDFFTYGALASIYSSLYYMRDLDVEHQAAFVPGVLPITYSSKDVYHRLNGSIVYISGTPQKAVDYSPAVRYTAKSKGSDGNTISVEHADSAVSAATVINVNQVTKAIKVTPGAKARMVVSGAGTAHANGTYLENGVGPYGKTTWRNAGCDIYYQTDRWVIIEYYEGVSGNNNLLYTAVSALDYPDGLTFTVSDGANPAPSTVAAGISNAAQVIATVNATPAAAALVTASAYGSSTRAVAQFNVANLTGGNNELNAELVVHEAAAPPITSWNLLPYYDDTDLSVIRNHIDWDMPHDALHLTWSTPPQGPQITVTKYWLGIPGESRVFSVSLPANNVSLDAFDFAGVRVNLDVTSTDSWLNTPPTMYPYALIRERIASERDLISLMLDMGTVEAFHEATSPIAAVGALATAIVRGAKSANPNYEVTLAETLNPGIPASMQLVVNFDATRVDTPCK